MKKLFLSFIITITVSSSLAAFSGDTVIHDTIIVNRNFYFTILGVGTENAQVAIIGNIAPANFKGTQVAGVFNVARGSVNGLQLAGFSNHSGDSLTGVQIAGCLNTAQGNVRGIQGAGAFNLATGNVFGAQVAGSLNIATGNVTGVQLSGGANIAWGNVQELQASGGLNFARDVQGLQISGGANIATGTLRGMQVSGGMNYAHYVKGVQIGVVNFADSVDGAMIGVMSFARHGYHKVELGWNETTPFNASFYTGSKKFHNILSACVDMRPRDLVWGFGYGIGTAIQLHPRFDLGINLSSYHMNKGNFSLSMSDLWKLNVVMDVHIAKNISIAAGPSLNLFLTDLMPEYNEAPVTGIAPYYFFTQTYSNRWNAKAWVGFTASARFF